MLKKAQQYLVARGKVDWSDSPAAVPTLRRSDSLGESRRLLLTRVEAWVSSAAGEDEDGSRVTVHIGFPQVFEQNKNKPLNIFNGDSVN